MKLQIRRIIRFNSSSDMNSPSEGMFKDYPSSDRTRKQRRFGIEQKRNFKLITSLRNEVRLNS